MTTGEDELDITLPLAAADFAHIWAIDSVLDVVRGEEPEADEEEESVEEDAKSFVPWRNTALKWRRRALEHERRLKIAERVAVDAMQVHDDLVRQCEHFRAQFNDMLRHHDYECLKREGAIGVGNPGSFA